MRTGTGAAEEQTQADQDRNQHFFRASLLRQLRGQAVLLHLQHLQGRQPNHFVCSNCKSNTGSCKIHYIREQVLYRIVLETIRQTLSYVHMFRKDFKLERLAQDEESRKVELAEKQKALSGAKKRMEDLDRLIQHIYEDNVLGELSDSRYLK